MIPLELIIKGKKEKLTDEEIEKLIDENYHQHEETGGGPLCKDVIFYHGKVYDEKKRAVYGIQKCNALFWLSDISKIKRDERTREFAIALLLSITVDPRWAPKLGAICTWLSNNYSANSQKKEISTAKVNDNEAEAIANGNSSSSCLWVRGKQTIQEYLRWSKAIHIDEHNLA